MGVSDSGIDGESAGDEVLMERYRDGDAAAFDCLYRRHRRRLHRYLLRQCGDRAVADELFQDVWMQVVKARATYVAQARFTTWLFRVAHNRLIDHYRACPPEGMKSFDAEADDQRSELAVLPAGSGADPAVRVESRQRARQLLDWLALLPPLQREAFLLQHEGEMSLDEIAETTGVGRETVKSRLRYANARLRALRLASESANTAHAPSPSAAAGTSPAGSPAWVRPDPAPSTLGLTGQARMTMDSQEPGDAV
jgi:RNA polymerase sigma factor (sigma-70 family)